MNYLYLSDDNYDKLLEIHKDITHRDKSINVICCYCDEIMNTSKDEIIRFKRIKQKLVGCPFKCSAKLAILARGDKPLQNYECSSCKSNFMSKITSCKKNKSGNRFCSRSCSTTYNNKHKIKGNRRSKLEIYLEDKLIELYPNLEIHFNRKDAINSELDIYIPSLNLAFELNGIFHYEPIFGKDKLKSITNNDNRKYQACIENQIELCIIDTSKLNYYKEKNAIPYLEIVSNIINSKLSN